MRGVDILLVVVRLLRAMKEYRDFLSRHAGQEFVFSDEKLFVLQQPHNVQNDRVWAPSRDSIPESNINIPRFQSAASVMV